LDGFERDHVACTITVIGRTYSSVISIGNIIKTIVLKVLKDIVARHLGVIRHKYEFITCFFEGFKDNLGVMSTIVS
jgi:hypothetical protein